MLPYLRQLVDERTAITERITAIAEAAAAEDRHTNDVETRELGELRTRIGQIDPQIERWNADAESVRAFADLTSRIESRRDTPRPNGNGHGPPPLESTSWGQPFVDSDQFRTYSGYGQSAHYELDGFLETRAAITTANLAVPHFVWTPVEYQFRPTILSVVNHVSVSSGVVDWIEVGADPLAAVVAEGAAKPEAAITLTPKTSSLDTLAHWVQITRQALDDATYIRSLLEGKLRRGLMAKAEADMATAIDAAATQTATTSIAGGGTMLKSIRVGIGKVEASGYRPNAVLLNPTDYATLDIDVMGTTDTGPVRPATFWGIIPIASNSVPAGKSYVGDYSTGVTFFDRGVTNVFLSDSHASLFISNILVILAEARVKSAVTDPLAICECSTVA